MSDGGVYYALPQTEVLTELTVEQTIKKPGKFPEWAKPLFGVPEIVEKTSRTLVVKPNPKITSRGVPDPEHVYLVKVRGNWYEKRTIDLGLDPWGAVQTLDQSITDSRVDIVAAVAKTVLGWAALPSYPKVAPLPADGFHSGKMSSGLFVEAQDPKSPCSDLPRELARLLLDVDPVVQTDVLTWLDRDGKAVCTLYASDEGKREFPSVVASLVSLGEMRLLREKMLEGELGAYGSTSDLVATLDKLDERIDSLLGRAFLGTESKTSWTGTIPTLPNDKDQRDWSLLVVDPDDGICVSQSGADLVTLGVPEEFWAQSDCDEHPVVLRLEDANDPGVDKIKRAAAGHDIQNGHGFVYRVPHRFDATLMWKNDCESRPKQLGGDVLLIAQYGPVVSLPTTTGGRTSGYNIALHPETGALKTFVLSSESAVTAANVTTVGDALVAREKAEREQDDQLARLKREKEILEAMKAIEDLREELGAEEEVPDS